MDSQDANLQPQNQIAENSALNGGVVVDRMRSCKWNCGLDASTQDLSKFVINQLFSGAFPVSAVVAADVGGEEASVLFAGLKFARTLLGPRHDSHGSGGGPPSDPGHCRRLGGRPWRVDARASTATQFSGLSLRRPSGSRIESDKPDTIRVTPVKHAIGLDQTGHGLPLATLFRRGHRFRQCLSHVAMCLGARQKL